MVFSIAVATIGSRANLLSRYVVREVMGKTLKTFGVDRNGSSSILLLILAASFRFLTDVHQTPPHTCEHVIRKHIHMWNCDRERIQNIAVSTSKLRTPADSSSVMKE